MQKAQESTQGINSLIHDTSMADVRVRNVTDRFMTLSDSQFIENRVYDEDVSADTVEDSNDKSKDETEGDIDPFPKLKIAIQMGLKVLEDSFDVLDPNAANSDFDSDLDSEDDDQADGIAGEKLYEPKDPYVTRPLPHLIGSRGFQESDDVGIRDLPSDDEVLQDDQGSISESDEDIEKLSYRKESMSSSSSEISESDLSSSDLSDDEQRTIPVATKYSSSSISEDGDLFGQSDSEDEPKVVEHKPKAKTKAKASHRPKAMSKNRAATNDLFGSEDDDDEKDLFGDSGGLFGNAPNLFDKKKKTGGLFDGADISDDEFGKDSSDAFDDESQKLSSEEEKDIPDHKEEEAMSEKSSKPLGGIALFGGALNKELLSKTRRGSSTSRSESMSQISEQSSAKKSNNLFAAEDSEEDDLFSSKPKAKPKVSITKSALSESDEDKPPPIKKVTPKKKTVPDLFGNDSDEDDMLFGDAPPKPVEKKVTKKPSLPKKVVPKHVTKQKPAIFDSESSDDDGMFSKKPPPMKVKASQKTKSKDLFDSDSDDDFFTDKKAIPKASAKVKGVLDSDSGDDLFADNADTATSKSSTIVVKNSMKSKAKESSLFRDSDEELSFDGSNKDTSISPKHDEIYVDNSALALKKADDLFGDDSEEEQKEPTPPPIKKKPVGAVSMFGGGFGGGELSAAILKRRGISDVSTNSSTNDGSEADKPPDKSRDGAPAYMAANKDKPDKSLDVSATISTPPKRLPLNSTAKPFKPVGRPSLMKSPDSVTSPQSSVSNLRSSLSINPASLLPGAAPKPKPVLQTEISFDKPPDIKTLDSVNKTRARGQKNRRPPTRHARGKSTPKNPVTPSLTEYSQEKKETIKALDSVEEEKKSTPSEIKTKSSTGSVTKIEPPTQIKDSLFDDIPKDPKPHQNLLDSADLDDELFSGSLFAKTEKKGGKSPAPKLFNDDIFGDDDDFLTNLTSKKSSTLEASKTVMDDADEDDIFGDLSIGNILGKKEKKKDDKKTVNVFDDDLFNEEPMSSAAPESTISKDKPKSAAVDDESDIFSLPSNEKSKTQSSKTSLLDDDEDIFGDKGVASKTKQNTNSDDDSDIFGEMPSAAHKPKSSKLPTKPDDDIFGDDIFSSKPPSKKKIKQSKTTKKTAAASIFDDEQDLGDIFASSSSKKKTATPKSTAAKKSSKSKEPKSTNSSVIDDPLSMP